MSNTSINNNGDGDTDTHSLTDGHTHSNSGSRRPSSRGRKGSGSASRRSRSRTRKVNKYLLLGRDQSKPNEQTKSAPHQSNGHLEESNISGCSSKNSLHHSVWLLPVTINLDMISLCLSLLASALRLFYLNDPPSIIFDELVLGAHISNYLNGEFYFHTNPPFSAQFYTLIGYLSGFDPSFKFSRVGKDQFSEANRAFANLVGMLEALYHSDCSTIIFYPLDYWNSSYLVLRLVSIALSSTLSPISYHIMRLMGVNSLMAVLPGLLIAYDPAFIVQSRLFSTETLVLPFIAICMYLALKYCSLNSPTYQASQWLVLLGVFIGLSLSTKYFVICNSILVFYLVGKKLWSNLAKKEYCQAYLWRQLFYILLCVFLLPLCIYILIWVVHVSTLTKLPPHEQATELKSTLLTSQLASINHNSRFVTVGSTISLYHQYGRKCWLHSHLHLYPKRYDDDRGSSHQQQVTCYPYVDQNNYWSVKKVNVSNVQTDYPRDDIIRHGDLIYLEHVATGKLLNSHNVAAPMTSSKQEVSGYVDHSISMSVEPGWIIEMESYDEDDGDRWIKKSEIKLIHYNTTAALSVTSKQLPKWGAGQFEVVADPFTFHENVIWIVDEVLSTDKNAAISDDLSMKNLSIRTIFKQILKTHRKILMSTYNYDDEHQFSSSPIDWLSGFTNVVYWLDEETNRQISMVPNIYIWYPALLCTVFLPILYLISQVCTKRGVLMMHLDKGVELYQFALVCAGGYVCNFLPLLVKEEQLFLYHYLPAVFYSYVSLGCICHQMSQIKRLKAITIGGSALLVLVSASFTYNVSSLVYGHRAIPNSILTDMESFYGWTLFHND